MIRSFGRVSNEDVTYLREVTVYPPRFFDPLSTGNTKNLLFDDTVSIHHYAATWAGNKQKWKRKLIRLFGENRYYLLKKLLRRAQ